MKSLLLSVLFSAACLMQTSVLAWDAIGHRLTATVALHYLSPAKQQQLYRLLQHHPRFEQDFLATMPASIASGDEARRIDWMLGQAAYWPDIARGLPETEARRFNRPSWHYTDGAWIRDRALVQGNVYVGTRALPNIAGESAASIRSDAQVHNIITALDYNTWLLSNPEHSDAERAVALCWVLHLIGDIHQPLHAGSLFSGELFASGDRGGNGIETDAGNLHARWDRALAGSDFSDNLQQILQQQDGFSRPRIYGVASDWSQWLNESRGLLSTLVYSTDLKNAIAIAEEIGGKLPTQRLDYRYVNSMQRIARQRLGLAGLRIAIWLQNELP